MKAEFPYTRLPGRRRGLIFCASLWMGQDHLLSVRNTRFSETYNRFYFDEIRAILIRRDPRLSVSPYWLAAFLLSAVVGVIEAATHRWRWFWATMSISVALAIWLLLRSLFGSCTTHVITAVSSEQLPALFRTRQALKALEMLSSRIAAAQGTLAPELAEAPAEPAVPAIAAAIPVAEAAAPPSRAALTLSLISFLFLFVDAGFTYFAGSGPLSPRVTVVNSILIVVESALLIAALVSLWPGRAARGLRNLIVASLVFAGAAYYAGYMGAEFAKVFGKASLSAESFFRTFRAAVNSIDEAGNVALGIAGVIQWRRTVRQ